MNDFTGRRPNERARSFGRSLLDGLSALGTAMNDGPIRARITEVDQEILDLQQERDHLIAGLYEPGELKVSENYDPRWTKPEAETRSVLVDPMGGRLTQCRGREYSGTYHKAHPACPYIDQIHNPHEFTLND